MLSAQRQSPNYSKAQLSVRSPEKKTKHWRYFFINFLRTWYPIVDSCYKKKRWISSFVPVAYSTSPNFVSSSQKRNSFDNLPAFTGYHENSHNWTTISAPRIFRKIYLYMTQEAGFNVSVFAAHYDPVDITSTLSDSFWRFNGNKVRSSTHLTNLTSKTTSFFTSTRT